MNAPFSVPPQDRQKHGGGQLRQALTTLSDIAAIVVGVVAAVFALEAGEVLLAPVALAIVVGLMFGPLASRLEARGLPASLSAATLVLLLLVAVGGIALAVAVPLSDWSRYLPVIWRKAQAIAADWRDVIASVEDLRTSLQTAVGAEEGVEVKLTEGSTVGEAVSLAPALLMQAIVFLAALYFFIATRKDIRVAVLSLCFERRLRWRVAHVFRDVETMISRYLLSISVINAGLGAAVAAAMWIAGVPSPLLWGVLAGVLNYVIYIGPLVMVAILVCVGLATGQTGFEIGLPAAIYVVLNLIEAQFVTPHVIGRTLTLNPFLVFLAIAFWIWVWGPIGGFIAVPALLIATAILRHGVPASHRAHARAKNLPTSA